MLHGGRVVHSNVPLTTYTPLTHTKYPSSEASGGHVEGVGEGVGVGVGVGVGDGGRGALEGVGVGEGPDGEGDGSEGEA